MLLIRASMWANIGLHGALRLPLVVTKLGAKFWIRPLNEFDSAELERSALTALALIPQDEELLFLFLPEILLSSKEVASSTGVDAAVSLLTIPFKSAEFLAGSTSLGELHWVGIGESVGVRESESSSESSWLDSVVLVFRLSKFISDFNLTPSITGDG